MKIIDLLNKIANGEEVPEKIKYQEEIFERVISGMNINDYLDEDGDYLFQEYNWLQNINDEVEIIEEDKKIDYLIYHNAWNDMEKYVNIENKINEIIDHINKINKGDK